MGGLNRAFQTGRFLSQKLYTPGFNEKAARKKIRELCVLNNDLIRNLKAALDGLAELRGRTLNIDTIAILKNADPLSTLEEKFKK